MEEKISHGITIDQCKSCKGLWFDKDELLAFCIMSGYNKYWIENALDHFENRTDVKETFCPRCKTKLNSTRTKSIQILNCDRCQGLYISNQEIQRLFIYLNSKKDTIKTRIEKNSFAGGIMGFGLEELISELFDL
jgi:Zn-finger nucleic acid-binding protein